MRVGADHKDVREEDRPQAGGCVVGKPACGSSRNNSANVTGIKTSVKMFKK